MPAAEGIQLSPRDNRQVDRAAPKERDDVARARRLREMASRDDAPAQQLVYDQE